MLNNILVERQKLGRFQGPWRMIHLCESYAASEDCVEPKPSREKTLALTDLEW
jgi:hypothetical protein